MDQKLDRIDRNTSAWHAEPQEARKVARSKTYRAERKYFHHSGKFKSLPLQYFQTRDEKTGLNRI